MGGGTGSTDNYKEDPAYKKLVKSIEENPDRRIAATPDGPYSTPYKSTVETYIEKLKEGKINSKLYKKILEVEDKNLPQLFSEVNLRSIDEKREEDYSRILELNL